MLVDLDVATAIDAVTQEPIGPRRLDTINLDPTPGAYDVDDGRWHHHYMGNHTVFVRYGAVIYPMLDTPGTSKALNLLREFMQLVGMKRMVVQAAPGTLALTPNREALSSSKMTEDGLTDLCVSLVQRIEQDIIDQIPASIMKACERLRSSEGALSGLEYKARIEDLITPYAVRKYLFSKLGQAKYAKYSPMLQEAERAGFRASHVLANKAATKQYHRLRGRLQHAGWSAAQERKRAYLRHYILRPLARVFYKNVGLLKMNMLQHARDFYYHSSNRKDGLLSQVEAGEFEALKQFIDSPTVFVTIRTKKLDKSIECCPDIVIDRAAWVYKITPFEKNKDAIIKAFTDAGMKVIDLTLNHEWDDVAAEMEEQRIKRNAKRTPRASKAGTTYRSANLLMSLCNVFNDETGFRTKSQSLIKQITQAEHTTDTPLFYVEVERLGSEGHLGQFGHVLDLTEDERKRGVIVRTGTEKNMAVKRGAITADAFFAPRLWERANSKAYQEYRTKKRLGGLSEHRVNDRWMDLVNYLGVKITGMDKLVTDQAMERTAELLDGITAADFSRHIDGLTLEQLKHYAEVIVRFKLDELPCITKLKALRKDDMLAALMGYSSEPVEMIKQFPERKAALKSLVMSALKNGNQDE
jgi:hypothetical protein